MSILILIIVAVVGIGLGYYLAPKGEATAEQSEQSEQTKESLNLQSAEKAERKVKIMTMFETQNEVTNDDVEKFLSVSNTSAERYLNELEHDGKLTQNGKTGVAVFYTLK
jgi:predicted HTH transcriptional regulator